MRARTQTEGKWEWSWKSGPLKGRQEIPEHPLVWLPEEDVPEPGRETALPHHESGLTGAPDRAAIVHGIRAGKRSRREVLRLDRHELGDYIRRVRHRPVGHVHEGAARLLSPDDAERIERHARAPEVDHSVLGALRASLPVVGEHRRAGADELPRSEPQIRKLLKSFSETMGDTA